MALRRAGLLATRRDGRFIFYRLRHAGTLDLICLASSLVGIPPSRLTLPEGAASDCTCPHCLEGAASNLVRLEDITAHE
jgi:hypothetical protein